MSARRWAAVGVVAVAVAAARSYAVRREEPARVTAAPVVSAAAAPSPPPPVVSAPRPQLDPEEPEAAPVAEEVGAVEPARIDGVTFATEYARDLCACTDGACLDSVNERHGGRLGRARASRDARAVSEQFRRAMACAKRIRGS